MAYEFNGTNQGLTTTAPVTAMPLTLACWFYPPTNAINGSMLNMAQDASNGNYYFLGARGDLAGDPLRAATVSGGGVAVADSAAAFNAAAWNHGAGVFTSTTSRAAYLNGTGTTNTATAAAPTGIDRASIGYMDRLTDAFFFNGQIAEVGIWNVALTAEEIASLAKGMTCDKVRPQSLVAYFPLVRDLVELKSGLAVTNNNSATVANHPRVYA